MTKCPVCNGVGAIYEGNTRIDECGNCNGGANCPGCDPYKEAGTCIPASYAAEKVFCEDCSMKWVENQGRYWEIPPYGIRG